MYYGHIQAFVISDIWSRCGEGTCKYTLYMLQVFFKARCQGISFIDQPSQTVWPRVKTLWHGSAHAVHRALFFIKDGRCLTKIDNGFITTPWNNDVQPLLHPVYMYMLVATCKVKYYMTCYMCIRIWFLIDAKLNIINISRVSSPKV